MEIRLSKPTPEFVDNMSVVLKETDHGSTLNKKTIALSFHFFREHVANNVLEVKKIHTSDNFSYLFIKPLVSNDFRGFYHECMMNG